MKGLKKFGAIICAIAMIVSSITYYPTSNVSAATALPKKVIGLVANSKSGSDTIENAIMFAWAGADDPANVAGYDPTVTSTVIYIYKDGKQVTKIGNATKGRCSRWTFSRFIYSKGRKCKQHGRRRIIRNS